MWMVGILVDLIQMVYYHADSCSISPSAFLFYIPNSKANCLILSTLSQIKGVPDDLDVNHVRRMVINHLIENINELYVS